MLRHAKQRQLDEIHGISTDVILLSLLSALLHLILEFISLKLESESCLTSLMHYSIICYNGRLGWVPFIEKFESAQSIQNFLRTSKPNQLILDYDHLTCRVLNRYTFTMEYEFTNDTALKLIKALRNLPKGLNEEKTIEMRIGKSFDNVDQDKLIDLLKETYGRVKLDISKVNT